MTMLRAEKWRLVPAAEGGESAGGGPSGGAGGESNGGQPAGGTGGQTGGTGGQTGGAGGETGGTGGDPGTRPETFENPPELEPDGEPEAPAEAARVATSPTKSLSTAADVPPLLPTSASAARSLTGKSVEFARNARPATIA